MGALAVACAIIGISNPVYRCDEPAALACELAVKEALDRPKSFERRDVVILTRDQSSLPGLQLRYEMEDSQSKVSGGLAECFFKLTTKPECPQPNGTFDRCFDLNSVRLNGRFLSARELARSKGERDKARVGRINQRDTKLVWIGPPPEPESSPPNAAAAQQASSQPSTASKPTWGSFPLYEISARGFEFYGTDYQRAEPLWKVASETARQACARQVKRGADRPYQALADCLSKQVAPPAR